MALAEATVRKAVAFVSHYEYVGAGDPETVVAAPIGSTYRRTDGGPGSSVYVKEADDGGFTGWRAL